MYIFGEGRVLHLTRTLQLTKPYKAALCPKDRISCSKVRSEPQTTSAQDRGH